MAKDSARKKQLKKLGQVKLTEDQRTLIAANIDTPFFKLMRDVILPSRVNQLALTTVSLAQDAEDLWYYKGRVIEADWLTKYLMKQAENIDDTVFENDVDEEGEVAAEDDTSVED